LVELLDIHLPAIADAIALAGAAADDVEESKLVELLTLGRGEVLLEQLDAALLRLLAAAFVGRAEEEHGARQLIALLRPPLQQPASGIGSARLRLRRGVRVFALAPDQVAIERVGFAPQPLEQGGDAIPGSEHLQLFASPAESAQLGCMLLAHLRVDRMPLAQQGDANAADVPCRVPLAEGVAVGRAERRPGAVAVGKMHADPGLETPVRSLDDDVRERRCVSPMLAEGPPEQGPQNLADTVHQPPCSCG